MKRESEVPLFWFLGTLLPVTMAWMGVGVAFVLTLAVMVEIFCRREVRARLRTLDVYLPPPSPWQLSAGLVRYSFPYGNPGGSEQSAAAGDRSLITTPPRRSRRYDLAVPHG